MRRQGQCQMIRFLCGKRVGSIEHPIYYDVDVKAVRLSGSQDKTTLDATGETVELRYDANIAVTIENSGRPIIYNTTSTQPTHGFASELELVITYSYDKGITSTDGGYTGTLNRPDGGVDESNVIARYPSMNAQIGISENTAHGKESTASDATEIPYTRTVYVYAHKIGTNNWWKLQEYQQGSSWNAPVVAEWILDNILASVEVPNSILGDPVDGTYLSVSNVKGQYHDKNNESNTKEESLSEFVVGIKLGSQDTYALSKSTTTGSLTWDLGKESAIVNSGAARNIKIYVNNILKKTISQDAYVKPITYTYYYRLNNATDTLATDGVQVPSVSWDTTSVNIETTLGSLYIWEDTYADGKFDSKEKISTSPVTYTPTTYTFSSKNYIPGPHTESITVNGPQYYSNKKQDFVTPSITVKVTQTAYVKHYPDMNVTLTREGGGTAYDGDTLVITPVINDADITTASINLKKDGTSVKTATYTKGGAAIKYANAGVGHYVVYMNSAENDLALAYERTDQISVESAATTYSNVTATIEQDGMISYANSGQQIVPFKFTSCKASTTTRGVTTNNVTINNPEQVFSILATVKNGNSYGWNDVKVNVPSTNIGKGTSNQQITTVDFKLEHNSTLLCTVSNVPVIQSADTRNYYTITTKVVPSGSGTTTGDGDYVEGSTFRVQASAIAPAEFIHWKHYKNASDANPTIAASTIIIDATSSSTTAGIYEANFGTPVTVNAYSSTLNMTGHTANYITGAGKYYEGSNATVTAGSWSGHTFVGWYTAEGGGGTKLSSNASYTISNISANTTVYAVYSDDSAYYDVKWISDGTTLKTKSYYYGTTVPTSDYPSNPTKTGYAFSGWSKSGGFTITSATTITANFSVNSYSVQISASGPGKIYVGGSSQGTSYTDNKNYGSTFTWKAVADSNGRIYSEDSSYASNQNVTITGNYSKTVRFHTIGSTSENSGYTGSFSLSDDSNNVNNKIVSCSSASYTRKTFETIDGVKQSTPTGTSTVQAVTYGYKSTDSASAAFVGSKSVGTSITIGKASTAKTYYMYASDGAGTQWAITSGGSNAINIPASYSSHSVTINVSPSDAKTAGCNATATPNSALYKTSISLTPSAAGNYSFVSFTSSDVTIEDNKFTMPDKDVTVTATFKLQTYQVSWTTAPTNGTIAGSIGGSSISPGASVAHGSTLTLVATPATGYKFDHWTGLDNYTATTSGGSATITVNKQISGVSCVFVAKKADYTKTEITDTGGNVTYTLVNKSAGTISISYSGIQCTETVNTYDGDTNTIKTPGTPTVITNGIVLSLCYGVGGSPNGSPYTITHSGGTMETWNVGGALNGLSGTFTIQATYGGKYWAVGSVDI